MKKLLLLMVLVFGLHAETVIELKKACDLNDGKRCAKLGYLYYSGKGVKKDYSEAKKYFSKACDLNVGRGCRNLGHLYSQGRPGVIRSPSEARKYLSKACDLNESMACVDLSNLDARSPYTDWIRGLIDKLIYSSWGLDAMILTFPVNIIMQIIALMIMKGRWRILAFIPLIPIAYLVIVIFARSNIWGGIVAFISPVIFLYMCVIFVLFALWKVTKRIRAKKTL